MTPEKRTTAPARIEAKIDHLTDLLENPRLFPQFSRAQLAQMLAGVEGYRTSAFIQTGDLSHLGLEAWLSDGAVVLQFRIFDGSVSRLFRFPL